MIDNLIKDLQDLFKPYRNRHERLDRSLCSDPQRATLSAQLKEAFIACYKDTEIPAQKLYRQLQLCVHPDHAISRDCILNGKMIFSGASLAEIDAFLATNQIENVNNYGALCRIVNEAYAAYEDEINKDKVPTGFSSVTEVLDQLLFIFANPHFNSDCHIVFENLPKGKCLIGTAIEVAEKQAAWILLQALKQYSYEDLKAFFTQQQQAEDLIELLDEVYRGGNLITPDEIGLMDNHLGMIKFHLQFLINEMQQRGGNIHVPGLFNYQGVPKKYHQYQAYMSLWHMLFAEPDICNISLHRLVIAKFADPQYTQKQFEVLSNLFSDNPDPTLLASLELEATDLAEINKNLCFQSEWNWLRENMQWTFSHGPMPAITQPWKRVNDRGHIREEHYYETYLSLRLDEIAKQVSKSSGWIKLNQQPNWYQNLIKFSPIALLIIGALAAQVELAELSIWILPAVYSFGVLVFSIMAIGAYGFCESFLDNLSRFSLPKKVPDWSHNLKPQGFKAYFNQVLEPLWRITTSSVDPYYTGNTKLILQITYPVRLAAGAALAIGCTAGFICDAVVGKATIQLTKGYFSGANLVMDGYNYCRKFFQKKTVQAQPKPAPLQHTETVSVDLSENRMVIFSDLAATASATPDESSYRNYNLGFGRGERI